MNDKFDLSNPLGVVVSFFAMMVTVLLVIIKFGMFGVFGLLAGLGVFIRALWVQDK